MTRSRQARWYIETRMAMRRTEGGASDRTEVYRLGGSDANGQSALNAASDEEILTSYMETGVTGWDSRDFWIKHAYIRSNFG